MSSAGAKCFPQFPFVIKPFLMPPLLLAPGGWAAGELLALLFHLNNFCGGMIHGLWCRATTTGCIDGSLRSGCIRLVSRTGGHCRRLLNQTLVDQQLYFHATVLCA